MSSAQPDDFNNFAPVKFEARRLLSERQLIDATETRALLMYEFSQLRACITRHATDNGGTLDGPVRITVEIRAEGQASP